MDDFQFEKKVRKVSAPNYNKGIIYAVTNTSNGKQYVGCTPSSLGTRLRRYIADAKDGGGGKIHEAIRKFGPANFKIRLLKRFPCKNKIELQEEASKCKHILKT